MKTSATAVRITIASLALAALHLTARAGLFSVQLVDQTGPTISGLVDTTANTFSIRSWSDPSPAPFYRVPLGSQLPLTLQAFTAAGNLYDIPDAWDGTLGLASGWAFLLPVGQDLTTVQWIQGPPSNFWRGASFGWGGLRNSAGGIVLRTRDTVAYVPVVSSPNSVADIRLESVVISAVPEASPALFGLGLFICCATARWRAPSASARPTLLTANHRRI